MKMLMISATVFGAVMAGAAHADGLQIEHAAARLVVIPEARSDISVTIQPGDPRLPPISVHKDGAGVVLDGGLDRRIQGCRGNLTKPIFGMMSHGDNRAVHISDLGFIPIGRLPVVTAHVPLAAKVKAGDAVWGQVGPTASLELGNVGCGDWTIGDVRGALSVAQVGSGDVQGGTAASLHSAISGSGDLTLASVGETDVRVAGSGDVRLAGVGGPLHADIAGSGDIMLKRLDGPAKVRIGGSGSVRIDGGHSPDVAVAVSGSGDFTDHGAAGALTASVAGSGGVHVDQVSGPVSKSVSGSGSVTVGR